MSKKSKQLMRNIVKQLSKKDFDINSFLQDNMNSQYMKTNMIEDEDKYILEAEIPGFNKEQIDLSVNTNNITITAKREDQLNVEKETYITNEIRYGEIKRSFKIYNFDKEGIKAKYNNGLLTVTIPKLPQKTLPKENIPID